MCVAHAAMQILCL